MLTIWIITSVLFASYTFTLALSAKGWRSPYISGKTTQKTNISVVIALRNESENIAQLIQQLKNQQYHQHCYEVHLVNDHSTDNTYNLLKKYATAANFFVHSLPLPNKGKKQALDYGIKQAKGELILTTDADCSFTSEWLHDMNGCYQLNKRPKLIIGLVEMQASSNWVQQFQKFEFDAMVNISAGLAKQHHAVLCNAANLAFQREMYLQYNSQSHITSGDDVFLLHFVKGNWPKQIAVNSSNGAMVKTQPCLTIMAFLNQRLRWGSKSRFYTDTDTIALTIIVFTINMVITVGGIAALFNKYWPFYLIWAGLKWMVEFAYMQLSKQGHTNYSNPIFVLPFSLIYPVYITIVGITTNLLPFRWKNRRFVK